MGKVYCNTLTVLQLKGLGKAGLYCDTVPSQATIRPGGVQATGAGTHWARRAHRRGAGARRQGAGVRKRQGRAGVGAQGARVAQRTRRRQRRAGAGRIGRTTAGARGARDG